MQILDVRLRSSCCVCRCMRLVHRRVATQREKLVVVTRRFVKNPYTQTSIKLPPIERVFCITILDGEAANNKKKNRLDIYNVVVLRGNTANTSIVEIYDSCVKSWRRGGHIPQNLDVGTRGQMIFSDGYFYCFATERRPVLTSRILVFTIHDGGEMLMWVEPMPEFILNGGRHVSDLFTCASRVLRVSIKNDGPNGLISIWEFLKHCSNPSWLWREVIRMPASLRKQLSFPSRIRCDAVGDCLCFISVCGTIVFKILLYNLNENSWNWIPSCPLKREANKDIDYMFLQPRPDIK
jgi:hypothetical protein